MPSKKLEKPKKGNARPTGASKKAATTTQTKHSAPEDSHPTDGGLEADASSEDEEDAAGIESSQEDEDDVDEEGMERLMKALGDDGLDEYSQAALRAMTGGEDEDEEDYEEEERVVDISGDEADDIEVEDDGDSSGAVEAVDSNEEQVDVPLDEAESVDEDAVIVQKVEIDNQIALARIRDTIKLDPSLPWTETLVLSYPETIEVDVDDDLNRELAIYKQALHGAQLAKTLAAKHNFPFTRPSDYFAEMVKSDAHMERIRQRLLDEGASIKRGEEKRREREGKKYGKQVQMEKLKERERSKKDMEERLKGLKRKRQGALDNAQGDDDGFDVAVEDAISDRPTKRTRGGPPDGKKHVSRQTRDKKFGFGGPGRRNKQNTKDSTDEIDSRGGKSFRGGGRGSRGGRGGARGGRGGTRGGAKRLGKSKRVAARGRS